MTDPSTPHPETDSGGGSDETGFDRRTVLKTVGAAGAATTGAALFSGSAAAHDCNCPSGRCVRLGKVDRTPQLGDVYTFTYDGITVEITVVEVEKEDGEVVCFKFKVTDVTGLPVNDVICGVDVKGGPDTRRVRYSGPSCPVDGIQAAFPCAPAHERNPNRNYYQISNVVFYICPDAVATD